MRKRVGILAGVFAVLLAVCTLFGCGNTPASGGGSSSASSSSQAASSSSSAKVESTYASAWKKKDGYTLKQVVAMSRHNLRAPQDKTIDTLVKSTPHSWIEWTAGGSELTNKGGVAETIMGEFFRTWLEDEGLIAHNYIPEDGAVRFYSNPRQRTLATTQYFSSGMLPVGNVKVEYHGEYDSRDTVFMPRFFYTSDSYAKAATDQIASQGGNAGLAGLDADLQPSYDLITEVLDYKNSAAFKDGGKELKAGDASYEVKKEEEPKVKGSLATANPLSDALVLQYYEAANDAEAGFGKELSRDQWMQIAAAKNAYGDRRYNSKLVGVDCAHQLVDAISEELGKDGRKFSFLCGHDSNQSSLLHALGVTDYTLPDTIETKTPIGGKILFEIYENASGEQLCNIRYVYATTDQVRALSPLTLVTPPASYDLEFEGIKRNADGMYKLEDVKKLLSDTSAAYDKLATDYPEQQELKQAA